VLERVFVSWQPPDAASYAYLLGLYPGDGCVAPHGRTARLVITLDGRYPEIVREAQRAVAATCPELRVFVLPLPSGRVAAYAYPRYFFSNLSADIRGLFCEYCDRIGVRWTQSNPRNISISHRSSVARLDAFIGPKR